jgi:hypothetical protein
MQVLPLGPATTRQKKMPHTVFGSNQAASFKKIATARSLELVYLTVPVFLDDPASDNFRQHIRYFKIRIQRAYRYMAIGKVPDQVVY